MKFNLLINPSHCWRQSNQHALKLARAMLSDGHQVLSVFFYADSAMIATCDESQDQWLKLLQSQPSQLMICTTMIEQQELKTHLLGAFKVVGLGQLTQAMELANKTVEIS